MKLRSLLVALAIALTSAVAARAQVAALYLNPVAERISNSKVDNTVYSLLGPNTTSRIFYGFDLGGYYDVVLPKKPFMAGVDIRNTLVHANNASLDVFQFGLKLSATVTPRLTPYIEPYGGIASSRASTANLHVTKDQYGVLAGADYLLGHRVSWRVFEAGYGSVATTSQSTVGGQAAYPSSKVINFSSGLTFRVR